MLIFFRNFRWPHPRRHGNCLTTQVDIVYCRLWETMPKKAKGKKKGKDKKNGAKKELPPPSVPTEEPIDELSRQFYLIQVRETFA